MPAGKRSMLDEGISAGTVLDVLDQAVLVFDADSRLQYANPAAKALLGETAEAGRSCGELFGEAGALLEARIAHTRNADSRTIELRTAPAEPSDEPLALGEARCTTCRLLHGESVAVTVEENEMLRSRLFERAVDAAGVGVVIAEVSAPTHPLTYVSDGACAVTGHSRDELLGESISMLQGGKAHRLLVDEMQEAIAERRVFQRTLRTTRARGEEFYNRLTLKPFAPDGDEVTHYVGIQEDVSVAQAAQVEREHTRRLVELGTLVGSVAHDFNNILMEIGGRIFIALDEDARPAVREELDGITEAANRGSELIRQLLSYARRPREGGRRTGGRARLRDMAKAIVRIVPAAVQVEVRHPDEVEPLALSPVHLEQILLNLARNAAAAMPDGGDLLIEVERDGPGFATLRVTDAGVGMAPDVLRRCQERFFTTKGTGGTGLGLSTVADLVERAGGEITIRSQPGEGTTIGIRLPLAAATKHETLAPEARRKPEPVAGLEGLRALVVEDEPGIRRLIHRYLAKAGMVVVEAFVLVTGNLGVIPPGTLPNDVAQLQKPFELKALVALVEQLVRGQA